MYSIGKLFFLYSESLVHAGAGEGLGAIDLPIQREKITNWPVFYGQSLKGAMREHFEKKISDQNSLFAVFGPDPDKEINNVKGDPSEYSGAVSFTDAKVLLFPVRSLRGTFAYITCPLALKRLNRDLEVLNSCGKNLIDEDWQNAINAAVPDDQTILVPRGQNSLLAIDITAANGGTTPLSTEAVLEEIKFEVQLDNAAASLSNWLQKLWDAQNASWLDLPKRLGIVSDNFFTDFVEFSTELMTRNKIDDEKGTVQTGALWTEECLPRETLLYSSLFACKPFNKGIAGLAVEQDVIDFISGNSNLNRPKRIWLGGGQTIGRGLLCVHFTG